MTRALLSALLLAALLGAFAGEVAAGQTFSLSCPCGYRGDVSFHGGRMFAMATGYCTACSRFASVTWKRSGPPPEPMGNVWVPTSGTVAPLYPCDKCRRPFLAIGSKGELTCCPKCGKATVKAKLKMMFD